MFKGEENKKYLRYVLTGFGSISLSILFFFLLFRLSGVWGEVKKIFTSIRPVMIGAILAYLLHPLCDAVQEFLTKSLPRPLKKRAGGMAVIFSIVIMLGVVYVLLAMILPQLYASIVSLQHSLPHQASVLMGRIKDYLAEVDIPGLEHQLDEGYAMVIRSTQNFVSDVLLPNITTIMSGAATGFGIVLDVIIGIIATTYLLAMRKTLGRQSKMVIRAVFKPRLAEAIFREAEHVDEKFGGFISGKIIDSVIVGIICYFFALMFTLPSALLISVIIGVTNILPFFGPFIGAIPSVLLILIQDPVKAVGFAIFILVLQQVDGNIIGPKILGNTTGLSSFWVLFAILLFGGLFGFVGMLIGVPVFAVIYDTIRALVHKGLQRNGYEAPPESDTAE